MLEWMHGYTGKRTAEACVVALSFDSSGAQIDGARDYQEDAFLINQLRSSKGQTGALLVVADGMGGHAAGNVASNMAVQAANTHLNANYGGKQVNDSLRQSILNANDAIRETIAETTALEGMGCTMVVAVTDEHGLWWASVGDSHLYLIRNRKLSKLNADHSYGAFLDRMEAQGKKVSPEPGMARNMLMSALTGDDLTEVDCPARAMKMRVGDRLILCSDGMDTLSHGKLIQVSQWSKSPRDCADALLQAVADARKKRQDNTTVVVTDVLEGAQSTAQALQRATVKQSRAMALAQAIALREQHGGKARSMSRKGGRKGAQLGLLMLALALAGGGAVVGFLLLRDKDTAGAPPAETAPEPPATVDDTPQPEPAPPPLPAFTPPDLGQPPPTVRDQMRSGGAGPLLSLLPGGDYVMGSQSSGNVAETPEHPVHINAFAIATHESSSAEYARFLMATGHARPVADATQPDHPVHGINWHDAIAYVEWLSAETGQPYRLPSEAEWEYAASAGLRSTYWWGSRMEDNRAHCRLDCGLPPFAVQGPVATGSFQANPFTLYDTAGNVAEWTADCWNPTHQGAPAEGATRTDGDCTLRTVRGGSFESPARSLRPPYRSYQDAGVRLSGTGLRVARDLTPADATTP